MKQNKEFHTLIEKTPYLKNFVQTISKDIKHSLSSKLSKKKNEIQFVISRFLVSQLLYSILLLLHNEPDCLIVLTFPSKGLKLELYADKDDHHRTFFLVDLYKNNVIHQQLSFWDQTDFISKIIDLLVENKLPRKVEVMRSSLNMSPSPPHLFIRVIKENYDTTILSSLPDKVMVLYNQLFKL